MEGKYLTLVAVKQKIRASLSLLYIVKGALSVKYLFKMQYPELTMISPKGLFISWPLKWLLRPNTNMKGRGHSRRLRITLLSKDKTAYEFISSGQIGYLLFVKISFLFYLNLNTLSNKDPSDIQESIWNDEKNYRKGIRKTMLSKIFKIRWMAGDTQNIIDLNWQISPQSLPSMAFMMKSDVVYKGDRFDTRVPRNTSLVTVFLIFKSLHSQITVVSNFSNLSLEKYLLFMHRLPFYIMFNLWKIVTQLEVMVKNISS